MTVVDGGLALVGEEFADENKGWALVRIDRDRCSQQKAMADLHRHRT